MFDRWSSGAASVRTDEAVPVRFTVFALATHASALAHVILFELFHLPLRHEIHRSLGRPIYLPFV